MSCRAPLPLSRVAAAPPRRITGLCAICAFFTAVIVLVTPGPEKWRRDKQKKKHKQHDRRGCPSRRKKSKRSEVLTIRWHTRELYFCRRMDTQQQNTHTH